MRLFSVLGYTDVNNALVEAASDPEVNQILMNFSSGGGSVNGVADLAKTIQKIDTVKPIVGYTGDKSMSASYWLQSATRHVSLADTALMGSIGVLTVHMDRTAQLAQDGIKATILRAGEFKALANPYEPLTDEAKAQIQVQLNDLYDMFAGHVQDMRGMSASEMNAAGQGREFMGKRAVDSKLADKVMSADKVIGYVKKIDKANSVPDNRRNFKGATTMHKTLNTAQLAAIAGGASLEGVLAAASIAEQTPEQIAAAAAAAKVLADEAKKKLADAAKVKSDADTAAASKAQAAVVVDTSAPVIAHLTAQLAAANEQVTAAKVEAASFKASAEMHDPLLKIVRESIGKMAVALGGAATAAETLDAKAAVAEYTRITETFNTKFKVGGVAATAREAEKAVPVDPRFASAVKSAPSATAK